MKIGILTHYYKSKNCGGLLQAFALQKTIEDFGFECEQIRYFNDNYKHKILHFVKYFVCLKFLSFFSNKSRAFTNFERKIPHSKRAFNNKSLNKSNKYFDAFVVGSDQVWHPNNLNRGFSLEFTSKPKISYAASIATTSIDIETKEKLNKIAMQLDYVSVRESFSLTFFDSTNVDVDVDPVFLIKKEEWEDIINFSDKKIIDSNFIFCYLLGNNNDLLQKLSKEHHNFYVYAPQSRIVQSPNLYYLNSFGPVDFLCFIKNTKYTITDSFHAVSFCYIFQKGIVPIKRESGNSDMSSRLPDLLTKLGYNGIIVNANEIVIGNNIEKCSINSSFKQMIEESKERLKNSLILMEKNYENSGH